MNTQQMKCAEFGITIIDTGYLREYFAASHMIVEKGKVAFVDVGTNFSEERLVTALYGKGLKEEDVLLLILTHIHLDHAGGTGQLVKRFPRAQVVVHPKGAKHISSPEKLIAGSISVYGKERFDALYGTLQPISEDRLIVAGHEMVLDFVGRDLHFFDTPGHARHHLCMWDPKSAGTFTGDTFGLGYRELQKFPDYPFLVCTTSPAAFEPDALLSSLAQLESLQPKTLYLTHYGPVAYHPKAIASLKNQIKQHASAALLFFNNHGDLAREIARIFEEAYTEYTSGQGDMNELRRILADDIELNAQGAAIWASRSTANTK